MNCVRDCVLFPVRCANMCNRCASGCWSVDWVFAGCAADIEINLRLGRLRRQKYACCSTVASQPVLKQPRYTRLSMTSSSRSEPKGSSAGYFVTSRTSALCSHLPCTLVANLRFAPFSRSPAGKVFCRKPTRPHVWLCRAIHTCDRLLCRLIAKTDRKWMEFSTGVLAIAGPLCVRTRLERSLSCES